MPCTAAFFVSAAARAGTLMLARRRRRSYDRLCTRMVDLVYKLTLPGCIRLAFFPTLLRRAAPILCFCKSGSLIVYYLVAPATPLDLHAARLCEHRVTCLASRPARALGAELTYKSVLAPGCCLTSVAKKGIITAQNLGSGVFRAYQPLFSTRPRTATYTAWVFFIYFRILGG